MLSVCDKSQTSEHALQMKLETNFFEKSMALSKFNVSICQRH